MTENIVTGKKYRILTDATQDIWDRISFWTKASDVYYDDNSNAEANRPIGILKRGTAYVVGTVAYEITAPSWVMLKCTTAGTTAASTPSTYKTISSSGTVITDGTAKFTVYDIRPTTTLSTNAYSVPTVSLLNTQISNLSKLLNKYGVTSYSQNVYLFKGDGWNDFNTLIPRVKSNLQSWIDNRTNDEIFHIDSIWMAGMILYNPNSKLCNKNTQVSDLVFVNTIISNSHLLTIDCSGLNHYWKYENNSFSNLGTEVPSSSQTFSVDVTIYQKN